MNAAAALLREPWAITAEGMAVAIAVATRDDVFADARQRALAARDGKPLDNSRTVEVRGGVAVVPMQGTMFRHADMFSELSGGVSYATLRKDLQRALEDESVTAILFDVDSPGGEVKGCGELAAAIYAARNLKPIGAYVGGYGCSAAYWLSSAASTVYCNLSSTIGCLGTCAGPFTDESKDEYGRRQVVLRSSQTPKKNLEPTTSDGEKLLQQRLDTQAGLFLADVATYRGVSAKKVAADFGAGDVLIGADAVAAGMADQVTDFEAALADMAKRGAAAKQRKDSMAQEQDQLAAFGAFEREVFALTGQTDRSAALGALRAMKQSHEQAAALQAQVKKLEADTRASSFNALLKQGMDARQISPAMANGEWIAEMRASEHGVKSLTAFLATAPKLVDTPAEQPKPADAPPPGAGAAAQAATQAFSAKEIEIAMAMTGSDPVALKKHLDSLAAYKAKRTTSGVGR